MQELEVQTWLKSKEVYGWFQVYLVKWSFLSFKTDFSIDYHTAFLGRRYPYELQQRKGSCFPLLWCIVVRKQALVFLKTYGLKNYRSLTVCKLASFHYYSPEAFLPNWKSDDWIIFDKNCKGTSKNFIWDHFHWCVIILRLPRRKFVSKIGSD